MDLRKYLKFLFKVFVFVLLFNYRLLTIDYSLVYADEKQWSGQGDAVSWGNASNWFPSGVPGASDDAVINAQGADVTAATNFSVQSIKVGGRSASLFTITDFVYGTIAPALTTDNALYIRKEGSVTLKGAGTITLRGALKNTEEILPDEPAFMFLAE